MKPSQWVPIQYDHMRTQQEGGLHPKKRCLRRKQTYQCSDLELPGSRTLRKPTSVVKASLWVWQCYSSPSRPIHHRQPLPATTYFRLPPQLGFLTELTFDSSHLPRHPQFARHMPLKQPQIKCHHLFVAPCAPSLKLSPALASKGSCFPCPLPTPITSYVPQLFLPPLLVTK